LRVERLSPASWLPVIGCLVVAGSMSSGCGGQAHVSTSARSSNAPLESLAFHGRCPVRDALEKASPDPSTASLLVPPRPTGALICRYWGINDRGQRPAALAGARPVNDSGSLARLVARLDALPPFPGQPAPSCPALGGRSEVIYFHYAAAADDPVRIVRQGCAAVSNGRIVRYGLTLPAGRHWQDEGLI
jgi:hypothetical protein